MRRVLVTGSARAPIEFSLVRKWTPSFRAGLEYMPRDERWAPVWNWRILKATKTRPAIALGQSTAWPSSKTSGSAFSLSAAKSIAKDWSAYLSASYAPNGDLWQMPAGLNYKINDKWNTRVMWDGTNLHPILTRYIDDWSLSLLLLDGTDPTLSVSVGF
ncbi:MAG: hypothetical protein QF389_06970 [Planctomycetota bacterium]|nr:hypothetical protein [Planctomycetota bacterium]MDP7246301.1 hypothetical protein [Planctomycetota bacterium]